MITREREAELSFLRSYDESRISDLRVEIESNNFQLRNTNYGEKWICSKCGQEYWYDSRDAYAPNTDYCMLCAPAPPHFGS